MAALGVAAGACGHRVDLGGGNAASGNGDAGAGGRPGTAVAAGSLEHTDKVDLLLVVDNSRTMADKQQLLRAIAEDLLGGLAEIGARDTHVGVVTSSLGGVGADSCSPAQGSAFDPEMDDRAHLVARRADGTHVKTYRDAGFLAWDPLQRLDPPGDPDLASVSAVLGEILLGAGLDGCGFEMPLEAWYRFLVDPDPYEEIVAAPCYDGDTSLGCRAQHGLDQDLLEQRASFLRPDSALVVVLLSSGNDCSTIAGESEDPAEGGPSQFFISLQAAEDDQPFHLPRATSVCSTSPDDPCCRSCSQPAAPACPDVDPECEKTGGVYDSAGKGDPLRLRCFDQKRRFGVDFLQPIDRYVAGLRNRRVRNRAGRLVTNPLFAELAEGRPAARGFELVFLTGIVGVPWQLISTAEASSQSFRYLTARELEDGDVWREIVGDPDERVPPDNPLLQESIDERPGLAPSTSPTPTENPINGHEWNVVDRDDLQYTCIFPLPIPRDCAAVRAGCDCVGTQAELDTLRKPVCQGPTGAYGEVQRFAKAYPSLRQLGVLKGVGDHAVVASICPQSSVDPAGSDFGYRPATDALLRRLDTVLR